MNNETSQNVGKGKPQLIIDPVLKAKRDQQIKEGQRVQVQQTSYRTQYQELGEKAQRLEGEIQEVRGDYQKASKASKGQVAPQPVLLQSMKEATDNERLAVGSKLDNLPSVDETKAVSTTNLTQSKEQFQQPPVPQGPPRGLPNIQKMQQQGWMRGAQQPGLEARTPRQQFEKNMMLQFQKMADGKNTTQFGMMPKDFANGLKKAGMEDVRMLTGKKDGVGEDSIFRIAKGLENDDKRRAFLMTNAGKLPKGKIKGLKKKGDIGHMVELRGLNEKTGNYVIQDSLYDGPGVEGYGRGTYEMSPKELKEAMEKYPDKKFKNTVIIGRIPGEKPGGEKPGAVAPGTNDEKPTNIKPGAVSPGTTNEGDGSQEDNDDYRIETVERTTEDGTVVKSQRKVPNKPEKLSASASPGETNEPETESPRMSPNGRRSQSTSDNHYVLQDIGDCGCATALSSMSRGGMVPTFEQSQSGNQPVLAKK